MSLNNNLYKKTYSFSVEIIKTYKFLIKDKEFVLSKQLLRTGTPFGANIAEANGAISKNDFSAKMSISYKECLETKYWLSLFRDTDYIDEPSYLKLFDQADELAKILFSILKTIRINPPIKPDN